MLKRIWLNRNLRFYLLGGGISRLGDILSGMAFLFIAYDLTNSAKLTTGMVMAETIPYLLFGLAGGVIADWLPKKRLLILLDLSRIPIIFSVVCLFYFDLLSYLYLLITSFLIQSLGCFFNPAHRTVLPLITKEEERMEANSVNDTIVRGITVLSPLISVWLLNTYGAIHFFTIDAISYAVSAYCISKLSFKNKMLHIKKSVKTIFYSIFEFANWARGHSTLRNLFLFTFITVFFNTWVWEVGILLALNDMTSRGEQLYSVIQGVFGGVVILTNMILPIFFKKMTLPMYLAGSLIWGLGITCFGLMYGISHFFIGCVIVGIGMPIAGLARIYLIQSLVPEEKMGRAFSFNAVLLYFSNTLSLGIYGVILSWLSIQMIMILNGVLIVVFSMIGLVVFMRKAELPRRFSINLFK